MDNLRESAARRAFNDTVAAQRTVRFMWGGEGVLAVVGGAWLTAIGPDGAEVLEQVIRTVIGGILGLLAAVVIIFAFNLILAPYRQRNDAIRERDQAQEALANMPGTGENPITPQPMIYIDRVLGDGPDMYNEPDWADKPHPVVEERMVTLPVIVTVDGNGVLVEQVVLWVAGKPLKSNWQASWVGNIPIYANLTFGVTDDISKGDHEVRLRAYAGGRWFAEGTPSIVKVP